MILRITSLANTPGAGAPFRRMRRISGTRNQSRPVIRITARSVAPTPVPKAPKAPWVVVWESVTTSTWPGLTSPLSARTWWQTPWSTSMSRPMPCSRQNSRNWRWLSAWAMVEAGA